MSTPGAPEAPVDARPWHGGRRRLGWFGVVALVAAFLLLPAIVDAVTHARFDNSYPDLARATSLLPGYVTELTLVVLAVTALRWWPVVLHEHLRARAWVWVVVAVPLGMSLGFTDWGALASAGWALSLAVLLACAIIGFSEELLFRGVILTAMRDRYDREWLAVLITTVTFSVAHAPFGLPNVLSTLVTGFLFYWMRRVSGGLLVPAAVHAVYDFAIYSHYTGPAASGTDALSLALFFVGLVLSALLLVLHKKAEPRPTQDTTTGGVPA